MANGTAAIEGYREGSRWINQPPGPGDVASWFKENARLQEGMDPAAYVGGLQLLSQAETVKVVKDVDGSPSIVEIERLVYTPYVRIDARIRYFWDLCEHRGWVGEIAPAPIPRVSADGVYNENLGAGFFRYPVKRRPGGREETVHFIGCTMQARAYAPDIRAGGKGKVVLEGPPATKVVPMLFKSGWEDPNAPLRAETGAIGRALGLAGILIIPGAGIATAEDMAEVLRVDAIADAPAPQLPDVEITGTPAAPAKTAAELIDAAIAALEEKAPDLLGDVRQWMNSRSFVLGKLTDQQERTVLRKLEEALKKAES